MWAHDLRVALSWQDFPGADIVVHGVDDLGRRVESVAGLVVATAAPRFVDAGVSVPDVALPLPSHRLYELLSSKRPASAHAATTPLRRVVSFASAAEHAAAG